MKEHEIEDLEDYMKKATEDRHRIFLKYLESFKEIINDKAFKMKKTITKDEVLSSATIAIDEMFKEVHERVEQGQREIYGNIQLHMIFKKHLSKAARYSEHENLPHSKVIRSEFKKTVSKTGKKHVYEGYETSLCVGSENTLVDVNYSGSPEKEHQDTLMTLLKAIGPKENSDIYQDMCDRFVDGKPLQWIADQPRNGGMSYQNIAKRMNKYIKTIGIRINQADKLDEIN